MLLLGAQAGQERSRDRGQKTGEIRRGAERKRHECHGGSSGGAGEFGTGSGTRETHFAAFGNSHGRIENLASSGRIASARTQGHPAGESG